MTFLAALLRLLRNQCSAGDCTAPATTWVDGYRLCGGCAVIADAVTYAAGSAR